MNKDLRVELTHQLSVGIAGLGLQLAPSFIPKIIHFIEMLCKWNAVFNLTAITEPEEIITRHILDSLSILPYIHKNPVLDLGSGAGFPGIPCALALPQLNFVLLDSNGKKTRFLTEAIAELAMSNVEIIQSRVEHYRPKQCFGTITARAFSTIASIINQSSHLLCPTGEFLLMKGISPEKELQSIVQKYHVTRLHVPGLNEQRHLITIENRL